MSIRSKIFLPLFATAILGLAMCAWIAMQAMSGYRDMASVLDKALTVYDASVHARERFQAADGLVDQVLAMTQLMTSEDIAAQFNPATEQLSADIVKLRESALSPAVSEAADELELEYSAWLSNARIVLGLTASDAIPTGELMARHAKAMDAIIAKAINATQIDAREQVAQSEAAHRVALLLELALVAAVSLAGIAGAFLLARGLSRPLVDLVGEAERLAAGDTSVAFAAQSRKDEIGAVTRAIVGFRDGVLENARLAEEAAAEQSSREARQQRVEQLIDGFRGTVGELLGLVEENMAAMTATADSLSNIALATRETAGSAANASDTAASNVHSVAAAAEELSASITEIGRTVQETTQVVERASGNARSTNDKVSRLATAASKIGEVVTLIQDIAEQTNLLALNATIEAARAGEAGRGFAVVASEVKQLAGQTAKATEEISAQISAIQSSTQDAVAAIQEITTTMDEVDRYAGAIAAAVDQQGTATSEISRNVQSASEGTSAANRDIGEVTNAAQTTTQAAGDVKRSAESAAAQTDRLRGAVDSFLREVTAA